MISSRPPKRDSLLFVYGTLRAFVDIPMARLLRAAGRHLGVARVQGRLYDLGRYPGLKPARRMGEWVVGDVYELRAPRALLRTLDRYEAGARGLERPRFVRARIRVRFGRRTRTAWLYRYRLVVRPGTLIRSGDYERHVAGDDCSPTRAEP
jgi:gamma-glutamylcyclotransferase (GGCT)/AIG2-like uncharacterized protein YtfP